MYTCYHLSVFKEIKLFSAGFVYFFFFLGGGERKVRLYWLLNFPIVGSTSHLGFHPIHKLMSFLHDGKIISCINHKLHVKKKGLLNSQQPGLADIALKLDGLKL